MLDLLTGVGDLKKSQRFYDKFLQSPWRPFLHWKLITFMDAELLVRYPLEWFLLMVSDHQHFAKLGEETYSMLYFFQ